MKGSLSVVADNNTVAELLWDGSMNDGNGKWLWHGPTKYKTKIKNIVKSNQNLRKHLFSDMFMDGGLVHGWQGFAGWFQALATAFRGHGLEIDFKSIIWPTKVK